MPELHKALDVDVEEDLLPLTALLHQRGVPHRIFEEQGRQVLKVAQADHVAPVRELYRAWRAGEVTIELSGKPTTAPLQPRVPWRRAPVTVLLAVASIATFLLFYLGAPFQWMAALTFVPFEVVGGRPVFSGANGEYWRLVTPVFLHFGWLHIAFNTLWLWELGSRVERVMGGANMALLFLTIALVSNVSQYAMTGPALFGGMSGVVYGLLGFTWVGPLLQPRWKIQPAPAIIMFMVGWLVVCLFGVVEAVGFGAVANAAHVGGLLCGAVLGGAFGLVSRLGEQS